jgi:peptidyl-prolyl cis-trans isomerase C
MTLTIRGNACWQAASQSEDTTLKTYLPTMNPSLSLPRNALCAALVLVAATLAGCGDKNKESKPGQTLARVDGSEITVLQLNEELQRAAVPANQQQQASKQLLQALIDRQLLENEAAKEKLDRDPKVMQAIERARALIIAQAYMQKKMGTAASPSATQVEEYFAKHPEFFANRKQFNMNELVIANKDLTPDLRAAADGAKSLEEIAVWLDSHHVKYARSAVSRSTSDLPPQVSSKLLTMPKGQIFIVNEGDRAMLISVADIKDAPVTLEVAAPQIAQALANEKNKEFAAAELKRLRSGAKIEYLNKDLAMDPNAAPAAPATAVQGPAAAAATAPAAPAAAGSEKAALDRGVAGLK